jgi:hypothetical protein
LISAYRDPSPAGHNCCGILPNARHFDADAALVRQQIMPIQLLRNGACDAYLNLYGEN